jgi:predicted regulator of Ras-like GTPase activity (Roadblock/LC7/MglB family)
MSTLPQLIEEDVQHLNEALRKFISQTDATAALVIDKGGFLIAHQGDDSQFDMTTIGALASGAFMANQTIAGLVSEKNFNSIYQQGDQFSMFVVNVDEHCLLVVIFRSQVGVGVVKFYSTAAVAQVGRQLATARERNPEGGLDLSELNAANPGDFFRKKPVEEPEAKVPRREGDNIYFECHECQQRLEVAVEGVGHKFACPGCGKMLVVPKVS